jgi:uncharacterized protein (TIGR02118 family)
MFRTLAMFPKTDGGHFDMSYFLDQHLPMVEALLGGTGLVGIEVEEGVDIEPPGPAVAYVVLASLTFDTLEALERAMVTYSAELTKDFPNFTNLRPQIQVNRVVS